MNDPYSDLLDQFRVPTDPFKKLTTQLSFLLYLLLGQVVILLVWRLLVRRRDWGGSGGGRTTPPTPPPDGSRWGSLGFGLYLLAAQVGLLLAWPRLVAAWQSANSMLLADVVVTVHFAFVLTVLLTLLLVLAGWPLGWEWTRNFWFRLAQLVAIEVVAGQAIVGLECPLTTVERHLRGGVGHLHDLDEASGIGAFCNDVLFYAPPEDMPYFFAIVYGSVGLLVLLTWIVVPPRWGRPRTEEVKGPAR